MKEYVSGGYRIHTYMFLYTLNTCRVATGQSIRYRDCWRANGEKKKKSMNTPRYTCIYVCIYMMRGDATTGKGSWRRARGCMYISSSYILCNLYFYRYICGDMEMSPIYTIMNFKMMPRKNDLGRRPESERK